MKKYLFRVLSALLMCIILSLTVFAAGFEMTISADKTTLHRGDKLVVSVAVDDFSDCKSGSLMLSYNENVFSISENKWLINADMSVDEIPAVFASGTSQALTGNVYQFALTVNADAAFGDYDINVTLTLKDSAGNPYSATKTYSVTISCNHSYGAWTEADTESHVHTCSICGDEDYAQHDWHDGEVQVQPGCTTEGSLLQTCNDCGATRTETMDSLSHDPAKAVEESRKDATCEDDGSYELVVYCKRCKEELSRDKKTISATGHKYDHDCDTSCNVCSAERSITHDYETKYSSDGQHHWYACKVCGDHGSEEAHAPGAAATEWDPQVCTKCGYVLQEALGHTHEYGETYVYDDNTHWLICDGCSEKGSQAEHEFVNDCDEDCDICGYSRQIEHDYSKRLSFNEEGHWYGCNICGDILEMIPHNPGPEATQTEDQICLDCGYVIVPAGSHEHNPTGDWLSDADGHWHDCACGEKLDSGKHLWGSGSVDSQTNTIIYRCSVCGYPRVESNGTPNPTDPENPSEPNEDPTEPEASTEKPTQPGNNQNNNQQGISPWIYVIAAVALLIFGGILFILIGILSSRKQSGRFSK